MTITAYFPGFERPLLGRPGRPALTREEREDELRRHHQPDMDGTLGLLDPDGLHHACEPGIGHVVPERLEEAARLLRAFRGRAQDLGVEREPLVSHRDRAPD